MIRKVALVGALAAALSVVGLPGANAQGVGGPIVLMGIDAEDCGPGGHGPITVYEDVVESILSNVTNGENGILVFGADAGDCVALFWDAIEADLGVTVDFVSGAADIDTVNIANYAMLAVASDEFNTGGGLTVDEHEALTDRQADIANFINGGGGLLGFSSTFDPATTSGPFAYLAVLGTFTVSFTDFSDIDPTVAGSNIGITNDLDVCCWHNVFEDFPPFLNVLAEVAGTSDVAALGGEQVFVGLAKCPGLNVKGTNVIRGTGGADDLNGLQTQGRDSICGLAGNDFINGGHGNDQLAGNKGHDTLIGSRGSDLLKGGPGDDVLVGNRGNDTLNGGKGFDVCKGGPGKDTFKNCEVIKDS